MVEIQMMFLESALFHFLERIEARSGSLTMAEEVLAGNFDRTGGNDLVRAGYGFAIRHTMSFTTKWPQARAVLVCARVFRAIKGKQK